MIADKLTCPLNTATDMIPCGGLCRGRLDPDPLQGPEYCQKPLVERLAHLSFACFIFGNVLALLMLLLRPCTVAFCNKVSFKVCTFSGTTSLLGRVTNAITNRQSILGLVVSPQDTSTLFRCRGRGWNCRSADQWKLYLRHDPRAGICRRSGGFLPFLL